MDFHISLQYLNQFGELIELNSIKQASTKEKVNKQGDKEKDNFLL